MAEEKTFDDIISLSRRLRAPGGCPWDRAQTLESLRPYVLEEAYEVIQAIEGGNDAELIEELGDFLFQVVFISQIAHEEERFDTGDVIRELHDKLVRRHPHVFGEKKARNPEEALKTWNSIKLKEKTKPPPLDEIPRAMPSLLRAQRVGEKASRRGFDWPGAWEVVRKIREELAELESALKCEDSEEAGREWGDLVFTAANLARHLGIDAETAAHSAVEKFLKRFSLLEQNLEARGKSIPDLSAEEIDALWEEVKKI